MNLIHKITLSSVMASLSIILNLISVRTDSSLYSIYALPLLLTGMLFGPLCGLFAGFTTGFIVQLVTYGLMPTTILWLLAPMSWGLISGLLAKLFHYKNKPIWIIFNVTISSISALFLNSLGMILDGLIYQYPTEYVYVELGLRCVTATVVGIIYCIILIAILPRLEFLRKKA